MKTDPKVKPAPNQPEKNIPTKPDPDPDPARKPEINDPTINPSPEINDPTRINPNDPTKPNEEFF